MAKRAPRPDAAPSGEPAPEVVGAADGAAPTPGRETSGPGTTPPPTTPPPTTAPAPQAATHGPHLVLSRKYRPGRFGEVVGQEHVAQTLANAITSGRIGHAYLFIGPRGTGKTTTARIFAKALNCERGPTAEPCGLCGSCVGIARGNDLDVVEMDAASNNGVDDVRALRDSVGYRPSRSRFRIWIVDEVHMLSLPAFNAFLKTLEEPPPAAKFLFCTTEAHKLPETFLSRVQRLEFRRIDEALIATRLESLAAREGLALEAGVCGRIASGALGGLRDAESLLEQLLSCAQDGRVTLADLDAVSGRAAGRDLESLLVAFLSGDAGAALDAAAACLSSGAKPDVVLDQTIEAFRGLLSLAARRKPGASATSGASDPAGERAAAFGLPRIARSLDLLLEKRRHLKDGADGRLVVEVAAVELARLPSARDLDALVTALARASAPTEPGAASGGTAGGGGGGPIGAASPGGSRGYAPPSAGSSSVPSRASASPFSASSASASPSSAASSSASSSSAASVASVSESGREGVTSDALPGASGRGSGGGGSGGGGAGGGGAGGGATNFVRETSPSAGAASAVSSASAGAVGGPLALATVLAGWSAVVAGVAGRSRRVGSALARTRVIGVGPDVVTLAIAAGDAVAKGALREREAAELVREVTREVFGFTLRPAVEDESSQVVASVPALAPASSSSALAMPPAVAVPSAQAALPAVAVPPALAMGGSSAAPQAATTPHTGRSPLPGQGLDEVRAHPTVKAVLDAFGARVLAVQKMDGDVAPASTPPGVGGGTS